MRRRTSALLFALLIVCGLAPSVAPAAQQEYMQAYTAQVDRTDLATLGEAGVDLHELGFDQRKGGEQALSVELLPSQADDLKAEGVELTQQALPRLAAKAERETGGDSPNPYYDVYRSYMEPGGIYDEMRALAAEHRDIIKPEIIGTSTLGKPIIALKMTENARNVADGTRPALLYSAVNHAREWIAAEVGRRLPTWFADHKDDDNVRRLLRTKELWFLPIQNPDGYDYTFTCGQGAENRPCGPGEPEANRLWRKTLRDNNGNGIFGDREDGVDPNRNYPAKRGIDEEGASNTFRSGTYRGPFALSEPENLAFDRLLRKVDFKANINYHSAAQLILTPVSNTTDYAPVDTTIFDALTGTDGDSAVEPYTPERSSDLYESNGDTIDNGYLNYGVIGWTPELDECETVGGVDCISSFVFPDDEGKVEAVFQKNLPMALNVVNSIDKLDKPRNYDNDPGTYKVKPTHDIKVTPFDVSYGDDQVVEATVRRSLGPADLRVSIDPEDDDEDRVVRMSEAPAGERYGEAPGVYYKRMRATVPNEFTLEDGTTHKLEPGDVVSVQVIAGGLRQRFSYRVEAMQQDPSKKRVLVVAAEDYTGTSPNRRPGYDTAPRYVNQYVQALQAAGYETATFDVDKPPANADGEPGIKYPTHLGVLSHFDAVVYETGDDFLPQDPSQPNARHLPDPSSPDAAGSQVMSDWAHHAMIQLRDFLNEGGKMVVAGRNVHQTFTAADPIVGSREREPSLSNTGPIQWAPDPVDFFFYPPNNSSDDDMVGTAFRRYRGISNDTWQNYLGAVGRQGGYGPGTFDGQAAAPKDGGLFVGMAPIAIDAGSGNDPNQDANGVSSPRAKSPTRLRNWSGISPQEPLRQERVELDVPNPPADEQGGLALSTRDTVTFGFGLEQVDAATRTGLLTRGLSYLLPTTADTAAPQASFKWPRNNSTATPRDPVEVDVTAFDERGDMQEVRLKADGRLIGTVPVFPFQFRYFPRQEDVGKEVTLTAEAVDKAGNVGTASLNVRIEAAAAQVEAPLPVNPPTLSGDPIVGKTLSCITGGFLNTPTSFTYEWLRNGRVIDGADKTTYTLTNADLGRLVACKITARNSAGDADVTSEGLFVSAGAATGSGLVAGAGALAAAPAPVATRAPAAKPRAKRVSVRCRSVSKRRGVRCTVRGTKGQRMRSTIRLAGSKAKKSRSGRGTVRVTLRRRARIKRSARVVVDVRAGKAAARLKVRVGRTARATLAERRR